MYFSQRKKKIKKKQLFHSSLKKTAIFMNKSNKNTLDF